MADRYPLIANSQTNRIEELASGDNLNLQNSGIVGATTITSQKFVGNLEGVADFSSSLLNGANILSGTISSQRLSGYYPIEVEFAKFAEAATLTGGPAPASILSGTYDIDITGTAQTANFLQDAGNINEGIISADRLTGVYNISITGTATSVASIIPGTYDIDITGSSGYAPISGISTFTNNVNVSISSVSTVVYPIFAAGIGYTNISIGSSLSYIPSTGRFGINTTSPNYTLDVSGDIALRNRFFAYSPPIGVKTDTGTLSSSSLIGVNTSSLQIGDIVVDVPQARIFNNTRIISIGNDIITISPNHLVGGSEIRNLSFSRDIPQSPGLPGQVLVSGGSSLPASWRNANDVVNVGVETTTEDATYNLVITPQTDGIADLRVDSPGLTYNPGTNSLSVGGTVTAENLVGNLIGIASTAIDVQGGIASVTQLDVSGISNLTDVTADTIIASAFIGDGSTLSGIVTQITAGIGVNVKPINGKGVVEIEAYRPTGKTIFVNQNGNDDNSGLSENNAKRTIKAAAKIAVFGDTIKVYPGVYVEENPIVLKKTVSVEGTELRNCVVTPRYPYLDLFHVNNGCHITDMSFIGPDMTDGAAVVALQTLEGVAVDRYFDAARMIRLNLDYIANETVGFLTSGFSGFAGNHREQDAARLIDSNIDYIAAEAVGFLTSTSGLNFTVPAPGTTADCADDIKDIFRAISYDLKANSNRKSIGAALSYFGPSGELLHITGAGVSEATIQTLNYAVGIAYSVINNTTPPISYQSGLSSISQSFNPSVIQVEGGCVAVGTTISQLVGIITSTIAIGNTSTLPEVRYGVTLESSDCADDVKDIWKCIIHDITRGGNSRCVDAGKAYYDDNWNLIPQILKNPGEVEQTVASIDYSFNVARAIINNVTWGGYPDGVQLDVVNADYNESTGITTITVDNHGLVKDDAVKITGIEFTCPSGPGIVTYPSGAFGYIFNVLNIIDEDNFEVVVGQSTLPHTYFSGGKIQKYINFNHNFYQVKDLGIQKDPLTGFNNAINGCANVVSALHSCVGIVTNIVGLGSDAFNIVGIRTSYPGNSGIGFTSTIGITSAIYDEVSGRTTIIATGINAIAGEPIELRDLSFSCSSGGGISTQTFPSGRFGYDFFIDKVNVDGSFDVYVGPSTLPHTYEGGGIIVDRAVSITTAFYDNITGIVTITATGSSIETGDLVRIRGLEFSCPSGSGTTTIYPTGNNGFDFRVLDIVVDKPVAVTSAVYDNSTGITTITAPGINVNYDGLVEIRDLEFSCLSGSGTTTIYPTGNNGFEFRVLSSIGSTFTINVGPSTIPHTYVSGGIVIDRTNTANDTFTINVGPSTIPHTYVSGGIVIPPFSRGVGPITQGPYVRNCTNFIPKSIGMKIDGFDAEPGDQDDIGVTGTMSVDSYTQYNQGGIGVSITNGAYAQLVSIFTICDDIAIFTGSGGQCDITNSNSSFGRLGLVANGVGDAETKSIYRSTGVAFTTALEKTNEVVVSGVGDYRPYDGQVCYFGELLYFVDTIEVIDGGSGYTAAPRVFISTPEGQNGITAQASTTIEDGRVVAVNIVNSGTQYRKPPTIEIAPPSSGTQATARVGRMQPIYYKVDSATLPSAGISTVSLLQNLNNTVSAGTTVYFSRVSLQITSSHSFEWVGSGNDINKAKPALGGVAIPENEVVQEDGGLVVYTSTDQAGNFKIGDGVIINQATGQISGRDFTKALFTTMTPFILALSE